MKITKMMANPNLRRLRLEDNNQEDGEDEPSPQILREYCFSFTEDNEEDEDESFLQISIPDASSSALNRDL